jgi:ribose 5-phosphate isomerase B
VIDKGLKVVIGSDHRGFRLKEEVVSHLSSLGFLCEDMGCFDEASVDYPDLAQEVTRRVIGEEGVRGILLCGTGIGMSISANKAPGIRAALCGDLLSARMCRLHNDANVLCIGAGMVGIWQALEMIEAFLSTPFEAGRHTRRVEKIHDLEDKKV